MRFSSTLKLPLYRALILNTYAVGLEAKAVGGRCDSWRSGDDHEVCIAVGGCFHCRIFAECERYRIHGFHSGLSIEVWSVPPYQNYMATVYDAVNLLARWHQASWLQRTGACDSGRGRSEIGPVLLATSQSTLKATERADTCRNHPERTKSAVAIAPVKNNIEK